MRKIPSIFIDFNKFVPSSNGTRCLLDLVNYLENQELKIVKINRPSSYKKKIKYTLLNFFNIYSYLSSYDFQKNDFLIACDTTPKYLLNYARKKNLNIIWWQLAPYKFLGNNQIPKVGELNLPFSSYACPKSDFYFYLQPKVDDAWHKALQLMLSRKKKKYHKICLYTGKGKLTKLPKSIRELFPEYKVEIITRIRPRSRTNYFKSLIYCDGLITFDAITQTNLEAASLGIPIFLANPLFPDESLENFSIKKFKSRITKSPDVFLSMVKSEKFPADILDKNYLESKNAITLKKFVGIFSREIVLEKLSKKNIKDIKSYSNKLNSKKIILPFINSGQAPSSLFINLYTKNLENPNKYQYIFFLSSFFDNLGFILNKLKLIRIVEISAITSKNLLLITLSKLYKIYKKTPLRKLTTKSFCKFLKN